MQFHITPPLLPDFVPLHGKWYPDRPAIIDEEQSLSWAELDRRSNQVANGLRARGIGRGDSVAILMGNCVEYVEIMYGILKAGAVVVPLNLAVNEDGLLGMMVDAAVRVAFFSSDQYQRLAARLEPELQLGPEDCPVLGTPGGKENDYQAWRDVQDARAPAVTIDDDDPCNIIYSSGTTGLPKGIKHLHRRRVQSMYELALAHRYHFDVVSICPIGLYSNIAWASVFCTLIVGGTCVIQKRFYPDSWIDTVERHGVTHTMMVPLQFQRILEAPNFTRKAVASLEAVISGGSPLYANLKERVIDRMGCAVIELYGLTEGFMTTLQPGEAEGKPTSVGKPVRGNDYLLVGDEGQPLPWGSTGEICVRSVHWMIEYHNRPDATEEAMYFDPDGRQWLRTGDIGRTDEDGYLYIVDRKKDMIISGGQNVYPADIEAVLVKHPAVAEAAVIGVPDEIWGETPLALVVLSAGYGEADRRGILEWTNKRIGKRQRLSGLELRAELPRNPNGKVLKRVLRRSWAEDQG